MSLASKKYAQWIWCLPACPPTTIVKWSVHSILDKVQPSNKTQLCPVKMPRAYSGLQEDHYKEMTVFDWAAGRIGPGGGEI